MSGAPTLSSAAQAALLPSIWQGFQSYVGAVAGDEQVLDEDEDDEPGLEPEVYVDDGELTALVLYPDGSGGIVRDVPPGRPPPAKYSPEWSSLLEALQRLPAATLPPIPPGASSLVAPVSSSATLTLATMYVRRLELVDRKLELKKQRSASPACSSGAPVACVSLGGCPGCDARGRLTREMRGIVAELGALDREGKRHAKRAGLRT